MRAINERDLDYLAVIIDHCERILEAVKRFGSKDIFMKDADYRDVVMMNIFQIGEASNQLSDECREMMDDIPWHKVYGTRNVIAHAYVKIDNEILWDIVSNDVPVLLEKVEDHTDGLLK